MIRPALLWLAVLALAACSEDAAAPPAPVAMTTEAVGYYCQMQLLEHPGPKAQAHLVGLPQPLFFSQVRDVVAYQRMPEQSHAVNVVYVSDMGAPGASWEEPGAENWIAATEAHYVVGSDIAGGMGAPELIPFSRREAAETFAARHGGQVMALAEIPDAAVLAPVETDGTATAEDEADFQRRLEALGNEQER
ncbi:MAG: NosL copper chaperone [Alphaproteobacteria bacterium]|nr:MAG: NosL copper chaperone [Alphaproteobacteria bacterium]